MNNKNHIYLIYKKIIVSLNSLSLLSLQVELLLNHGRKSKREGGVETGIFIETNQEY